MQEEKTEHVVYVTGTKTIHTGTMRIVRFTGPMTLIQSATSIILPTGSNTTTAAENAAQTETRLGFRDFLIGIWESLLIWLTSLAPILVNHMSKEEKQVFMQRLEKFHKL
jgi:hypothetical protein